MTEQSSTQSGQAPAASGGGGQAPLPGQGTGGCLGLVAGLSVLVGISIVTTAIGFAVARALGWV